MGLTVANSLAAMGVGVSTAFLASLVPSSIYRLARRRHQIDELREELREEGANFYDEIPDIRRPDLIDRCVRYFARFF